MIGSERERGEMIETSEKLEVEVWNTARINLDSSMEVSLLVDEKRLASYVNSRLLSPVDPEMPKKWNYVFDMRGEWQNLMSSEEASFRYGFAMLQPSVVFVNVPAVVRELGVEKIVEGVCRVLVHETEHVRGYMNRELREAALRGGKFKKIWSGVAYGGTVGLAAADGAIGYLSVGSKRQYTRRDFLGLMLSMGGASYVGTLLAPTVVRGSQSFFDRYVDPVHMGVYEYENNWRDLEDVVSVG